MRRRLIGACVVTFLAALSSSGADAYTGSGFGGGAKGPRPAANAPEGQAAGGSIEGGTLNMFATDMTLSTALVASGSASARPVCSYRLLTVATQEAGVDAPGARRATPYIDIDTREYVDGPGPRVGAWMSVSCPGGGGGLRFVPTREAVDVQAVIDLAVDRARASLPVPTLAINPAAGVGAPAQLGLWLAVEDPGQINVVAQVGEVWAAATARYVGTSWDMGNGDVVECDGLGTPYPVGSNIVDEGPCGYTYRLPSDIGVRRVTVSGRWSVQLTTFDGRDELLDPGISTTGFDYRVYEIVAVGEPG